MRAPATILALLGLALLAGACRNSCQQLCVEMHDYARDECGLPVTDQELDDCIAQEKGKESKDDRAACREFGDPETLREEWSCEDLAGYWGSDGGGGGDSGT